MHEVAGGLAEQYDDVGDDVRDDHVESAVHFLRHVSAVVGEDRRFETVAPSVLDGGLHGQFIDVDAFRAGRSEEQRGDGQNAASAPEVQNGLSAADVRFQGLEAQPGGLVGAGTEGEAGFQVQDLPVSGVGGRGVFLPDRLDEQALSDRRRLEKVFPVVLPVLVFARGNGHFVFDAGGAELLPQERDGLGRVLAGLEVKMNDAFAAVPALQVFIDEVDMGDLVDLLLQVPVVFKPDAVGNRHVGDVSRGVDALRRDRDGDLRPRVGVRARGVCGGAFRQAGGLIHDQSSLFNSFADGRTSETRPWL